LSEQKAVEILRTLFEDATGRRPTYAKIGTIKAMIDLGEGWHSYREIQKELSKVHPTGNVYVFYLARLYPELIEVDKERRVRITPKAFPIVKKTIGKYAKEALRRLKSNAISF
jgi:hypothetical protein